MEDLLQELSNKPDISSFYRTLDEPLLTTVNQSSLQVSYLSFVSLRIPSIKMFIPLN
jgi:hypothetical protein